MNRTTKFVIIATIVVSALLIYQDQFYGILYAMVLWIITYLIWSKEINAYIRKEEVNENG